jgi:hypothetical protein
MYSESAVVFEDVRAIVKEALGHPMDGSAIRRFFFIAGGRPEWMLKFL